MSDRRLVPVWIALLLLSGMFLLGEEGWTPPSPSLAGYSNSGCLAGAERAAEGDQDQYPWCGGDEIEMTVEGNTIRILHRNADN